MSIAFENLSVYLLVFVRLFGCIALNPIFARRNIPMQVKLCLVLLITILVAPTLHNVVTTPMDDLTYVVTIFKEVMIGLSMGFVFQMFQHFLLFAGELLDMQFGLSMAKVFDPATNIQASILGSFINYMFVLYFFSTGSHLVLIEMFTKTFEYLPIFEMISLTAISGFMIDLFISVFVLVVKLATPFILTQYLVELCMGILMKVIPQIHIFVINIQVKILMGFGLLLVFISPLSYFLDQYIVRMMRSIQEVIFVLMK